MSVGHFPWQYNEPPAAQGVLASLWQSKYETVMRHMREKGDIVSFDDDREMCSRGIKLPRGSGEPPDAPATYTSGDVRQFSTGAVRSNDVDHLRYDLIPHVGLSRLAARYGMGAERYGDHNYLRGIPYSNIINHMQAHLEKFKADRCTKDDNLAAIAWGAFALMAFEALERADLDDLINFNPVTKD